MDNPELYKYQIVKKTMIQDIERCQTGTKLTNRNELAIKYKASRVTIERAVTELAAEGYLSSKKGSGTFVVHRHAGTHSAKSPPVQKFLHRGDGKFFALLISNILNDIYPYILRGVQDVMSAHGINLIVCNTDNEISKQEQLIKKLIGDGVSGLIIVPAILGDFNAECFRELKDKGIPFVTCFRALQGMFAPGVFCNSFQSGYICTEHLIKHGCKKIAYISAPLYATSFDRYQGYLLAHENYKLKPQRELLVFDNFFDTCATGVSAAEELFTKRPDVDGIFAFNDRIAAGIYESMQKRGLVPGADIKIVSCDNTGICTSLPIQLTSARFPVYDVGEHSARLLIDLFEGSETDDMRKDVVSAELIIRNSCGCRNGHDV